MTRIYRGDAVTRFGSDERYLVVQATDLHLHLISESSGNRWNDKGIKFTTPPGREQLYITDIEIAVNYPTFKFKDVIRLEDRKQEKKQVTQQCKCTKPKVSTQRLREIAAYSAIKSASAENLRFTVDKMVDEIVKHLKEEGIVE